MNKQRYKLVFYCVQVTAEAWTIMAGLFSF